MVAVLLALLVLYLTSSRSPIVPLLAVALVLSTLISWRMGSSTAHWAVRVALYGAIVALSSNRYTDLQAWIFDANAVNAFGQFCAAETVIQCWRRVPWGGPNGWGLIFLSGLTWLGACTTFATDVIRWAAPVFTLFFVLSLTRYGPRLKAPLVVRGGWLRAGAVALALLLGAGFYAAVWLNRGALTALSNGQYHPLPGPVGFSGDPELRGGSFNQPGALNRVLFIDNLNGAANHLRGLTFDTYARGRWEPGLEAQTFHAVKAAPSVRGTSRTRVTTLGETRGVLFLPLAAGGLDGPPGQEVRTDGRGGGAYRVEEDPPSPYGASLRAEGQNGLTALPLSPTERARCLAVPPEIDPRVRVLARQLTAKARGPQEKTAAITDYLLTHYGYSLGYQPPPGDPVSGFILARKPAHCEYFGSAAVILLRLAGVPARYVTGYYAHENAGKGVTVVRQRDAHAWAEAWTDGFGWQTVDATPGNGRPDAFSGPVPPAQRASEWLADRLRAAQEWLARFTLTQIAGALICLWLAYLGLKQLWERWRPRRATGGFSYARAGAQLDQLEARFDAFLRRQGRPCPPFVPWQEHLARTSTPEADAFVRAYNRLRFGGRVDPAALSHLAALLRDAERVPLPAPSETAQTEVLLHE